MSYHSTDHDCTDTPQCRVFLQARDKSTAAVSSYEDATRILFRMSGVSDVSGDSFPFSLPRAFPIGRPAVCCGVVLPVCLSVVSFSKFHQPDTHGARHARLGADNLARMSLGCYEEATSKLLPWNLSYNKLKGAIHYEAECSFPLIWPQAIKVDKPLCASVCPSVCPSVCDGSALAHYS